MSQINHTPDLENMLCHQFEDLLSDYIEKTLDKNTHRAAAEHVLRCPLCHELFNEVKAALSACDNAVDTLPKPSLEFEHKILSATAPEIRMSCDEFETLLTDYLDGFLPAHLFHRWERHAVVCGRCTNLPGEVVRSIGACYTFKAAELPVPAGLHARILEATLGTADAGKVQMSVWTKIEQQLENIFKPIFSPVLTPQFASVAMMLGMWFVISTNAGSADGSIGSVYRKGVQLAAQTYEQSADVVESGFTDRLNPDSPSDSISPNGNKKFSQE